MSESPTVRWLRQFALAAAGLLVAFPFFWMVSTALKTLPEALAFPPRWIPQAPQWINFATAWQAASLGTYLVNSLLVSGGVLLAVLGTALPAGYAFGQMEFPGKRLLFGLCLATLMIPFEVTLIPNFLMVRQLGWYDSYAALIIPWGASAFAIFLLTQFFRSLPPDFREAAVLDGCGHTMYLCRVAAPLARTPLATAGLFAFLGSWNSLLWPLLVTQNERIRPIEVGLRYFLQAEDSSPHLLMAASCLAVLPVLALFLAAQRTFIEGVAAGVKG